MISFEPEAANCELLERSAAVYRKQGADWRVRQVAVAAERGSAELHVMRASWGHALHPPARFTEHEVGIEQVRVEAMADVLEEALRLCGADSRLVVKVTPRGRSAGSCWERPLRSGAVRVRSSSRSTHGPIALPASSSSTSALRVFWSHRVQWSRSFGCGE